MLLPFIPELLSSRLLSKNTKIRIYKTVILPVVLYGCETWSLTLRWEHRPRQFENRVLWRIYKPKRDKLTGCSRNPHKKELNNMYSSPSIIRMMKSRGMRWAWHVARMGLRGMHIGYWMERQKERGEVGSVAYSS
jgi:hypothetical protein